MLLKRELGPIFRAIKAIVGVVLQGRGGDSPAQRRCFKIGHELALISP